MAVQIVLLTHISRRSKGIISPAMVSVRCALTSLTGARRDDDGYYFVTGRVDDLMNVSGHLLSTAEIESALVAHKCVAEAAVVAAPDDIKGHVPYAFVTLIQGETLTPQLIDELKQQVRKAIGPIATPDTIQLAPALPKTRSGKITRRILRIVAAGDDAVDIGDQSSLADPEVRAPCTHVRTASLMQVVQSLWTIRRQLPASEVLVSTNGAHK
jgi:hypothetical protein